MSARSVAARTKRGRGARTLACAVLLLAVGLPGCAAPSADGPLVVPPPRAGDVVEYEVTGPYLDLVRWEPDAPPALTRVRLTVEEGGPRLTSGLATVDTFLVRLDALGAGGWTTLDERHVSRASNRVVSLVVPYNATERVQSWEDLGAPWAFGASLLMGRTLDGELDLALPAAAGQPAALPIPFRAAPEGDLVRVEARSGAALSYLWRSGETYPETFRLVLEDDSAGYAASRFPRGQAFEGRKVAETRGGPVVAGVAEPEPVPAPVAEPAAWDGRAPPERGDGLVFPLADAMEAAELQDVALRRWLDANAGARLNRATYWTAPSAEPLPREVPAEPTWNLGYVSPASTYYEVKVARAAGLPVHRTYDSGPVDAPRGEHAWFEADALPERLLPLDDAVRRFQETFGEASYEIFVRSVLGDRHTPTGYYYLIDGGHDRPAGRYTTTWSAQTGLLESAVGPMDTR